MKEILKWLLFILLIPISYLVISLVFTFITIDRKDKNQSFENSIYLGTNGVHLDIVFPKKNIDSRLLDGIHHEQDEKYLSFGWGDENFYLNTPRWSDLTFFNAIKALFVKSNTLIHVTRYERKRTSWIEIKVSDTELHKLNSYILQSFKKDVNGNKIILENQGYSEKDDFYKSKGHYTLANTCNSWVNTGFKESGLKSCLWTPFDFGLMRIYR
ncbi:MAG: DUF2459 domain-containing protein [Cryomorphaceae bacterium]|nr:DUF2459 domain-containing protein [Cryomorphaceae bacterium]